MRSVLVSVISLAVMGIMSSVVPKMVAKRLSEPSGLAAVTAIPATAAAQINALAQSLAGQGVSPQEALKQLEKRYENAAPEEQELYKSVCPEIETVKNPLIQKMLEMGKNTGGGADAISAQLKKASDLKAKFLGNAARLKEYTGYAVFIIWLLPTVVFLAGVLFFMFDAHHYSRLACGLVFEASHWTLSAFAVAGLVLQIASGLNVFALAPGAFWIAPTVYLIASAGMLNLVDMNYPFWNSAMRGLSLPVICSLLGLGWAYGLPYLQSVS